MSAQPVSLPEPAPPAVPAPRRRWRRVLGAGALLVLLAAAASAWWARAEMRASLPQLDGQRPLAGLTAPVRVERDALGVPLLSGATRADVARTLGFLHGQERFFQMDLMRRRAAGELAEIVGPAVFDGDRRLRVHRFRAVARRILAQGDA